MVFDGNLFITGGCGHMIIYFFSKNLPVFTYLHTKSMAFTVCEYCMWVYLGWWPPYNPMWPPLFPHEFLIFDVWVASNIPSSDSIPQNSPNYGCFNIFLIWISCWSNPIMMCSSFILHDIRIISPCRFLKTGCLMLKNLKVCWLEGFLMVWWLWTLCFWWAPSVFDGHIPTSVSLTLQ